jgi:hypothetical protein
MPLNRDGERMIVKFHRLDDSVRGLCHSTNTPTKPVECLVMIAAGFYRGPKSCGDAIARNKRNLVPQRRVTWTAMPLAVEYLR